MTHIKKKRHKLKYILIIVILVLFYYLISQSSLVEHYAKNPGLLRDLILNVGYLAPAILILLQIIQTTISIIPSQVTTVVAGFVFGPILGLLYSLIGAFFGSALIFLISRKYGKKLALKLFEKKDIVHFNLFLRQKKAWALFLSRVSPLFPNDIVSFTAGLTDIKFWKFNLASMLGFVVQMIILVFFGAELINGKISIPLLIFSFLVSLSVVILIFKHKIRKLIIKDFHQLEKEGQIIEQAIEREFREI